MVAYHLAIYLYSGRNAVHFVQDALEASLSRALIAAAAEYHRVVGLPWCGYSPVICLTISGAEDALLAALAKLSM